MKTRLLVDENGTKTFVTSHECFRYQATCSCWPWASSK
jgi:hypothetical protein